MDRPTPPPPVMPTIGRRRAGAPLRTPLAASVHGGLAARRGRAASGQDVRERFGSAGLLALLDMEDRGEVAYSTTAGWSTVRPGIMGAPAAGAVTAPREVGRQRRRLPFQGIRSSFFSPP